MFIYTLKNDRRGMTLIEMIVSLVILSILMTSTMGMITSSMNIFTANSNAAIDRMVGNSIFYTMQNTLRYATKIEIKNAEDINNKLPSFCIGNSRDERNPSGELMFRRARLTKDESNGSGYIRLYDDRFYSNRTVQYSVHKVDNRHIELLVNIFRGVNQEKKQVYTKKAVIKCVNIELVANNEENLLLEDSSSPSAVNQYIYFSNDDLLALGGSNAWSTEFKINSYMEKYNEIQQSYYDDLKQIIKPMDDLIAVNGPEDGYRHSTDKFNSVYNARQMAIFGTLNPLEVSDPNSLPKPKREIVQEGNHESKKFVNLRGYYQNKINKLLKFTPTNAGLGKDNPYYGVVATKEELYTGFMLNYYDGKDNNLDGKPDGKPDDNIDFNEYPSFSTEGFFNGTVFENRKLMHDKNAMKILCYFKDNINEDFSELCVLNENSNKKTPVYVFTVDKDAFGDPIYIADNDIVSDYPNEILNAYGFDPKLVHGFSDYTLSRQAHENLCVSFRSRNNTYLDKTMHPNFVRFMFLYEENQNQVEENVDNTPILERFPIDDNRMKTYKELLIDRSAYNDSWDGVKKKRANELGADLAKELKATCLNDYFNHDDDVKYGDTLLAKFKIIPDHDLTEGWYYIKEPDPPSDAPITIPKSHIHKLPSPRNGEWEPAYNYYFFYLEGVRDYDFRDLNDERYEGIEEKLDFLDKKLTENNLKTADNQLIALQAGKVISFCYDITDKGSNHNRNHAIFYYYDRARLVPKVAKGTDGDALVGVKFVDTYTLNKPHKYNDYILYATDWDSWFVPGDKGIINKTINGIASWFTNQSEIKTIGVNNPQDALGFRGRYNVDSINKNIASYNICWAVYNSRDASWYYIPNSADTSEKWIGNLSWTSKINHPRPLDLDSFSYSSTTLNATIQQKKIPRGGLLGLAGGATADKTAHWVRLPIGDGINKDNIG